MSGCRFTVRNGSRGPNDHPGLPYLPTRRCHTCQISPVTGNLRRNLPEEIIGSRLLLLGFAWANPLIEHCNIKVVTPVPTAKALQVCLF